MMLEPDRRSSDPTETPGFVQALRVLRERWWVILTAAVVCAGVALAYAEHQPKKYTATAKLQFSNSSVPSEVAGVPQPQAIDPEGEKATYLQLVTTIPVAELVVRSLKLNKSSEALLEEVTATNPDNDYIIDISATNGDPEQAAAIANSFAEQYTVYSQKQNEAQLVRGEELINKKLEQLPSSDTTDAANLRALYQKLLLLQAVQTANAHVVNTAAVPTSPSSPKIKDTVIIAAIVGILIGVALIFVFNMADRRVKSLEALEALYALPAMATIPRLPRKARTARQREITMEPFRILHNALPLISTSEQIKSVLVTSAVSNEGKTTVALGLARAAADAGQRVVLVEADLRHPSLAARVGLSTRPRGLADALLYDADPIALVSSPPNGPKGLEILTSDSRQAHAVDLLGSGKLVEVFSRLATYADLVVIDSAPLLPVADTRTLLDRVSVDACLIVGRVATTTKEQVRRARAVLDQRHLLGVGLVVDDTTDTAGDYYYGDGHGSASRSAEGEPSTALSRPGHDTSQ